MLAWTFLDAQSRASFKYEINLDDETWARARGWALWKALITLADMEDKTSTEAEKQKQIINAIHNDSTV